MRTGFFQACRGRRFAHGMGRDGEDHEHGEHGRGGRRHWGGRGRHGRPFDHGHLRLLILRLIAEKPRHGYEIIKAIEEKLGGSYAPSPGVVYPTLTLLEEMGLVALQAQEGSRKLYGITPEGTAHLEENRSTIDAILGRLADMGGEGGRHAPQIVRAMHNLKMAVRLRLGRCPLDAAQVAAVAAALDAAAQAVERT